MPGSFLTVLAAASAGLAVGLAGGSLLAGSSAPTSAPAVEGKRKRGRPPLVPTSSPLPSFPPSSALLAVGPIADVFLRQAYAVSYDRRLRIPSWTAEHLTPASLARPSTSQGLQGGDRQNSQFRDDPAVPSMWRSRTADYWNSGYDRGHMVPAADAKRSQEAMDETFLLTNIAPQVGDGFNRHYWAYTEAFCRDLTRRFSSVWVFTVPLFLPALDPRDGKYRVSYEVLAQAGTPTVAVPTHFAKVIMAKQPHRPDSGPATLPPPDMPELPLPLVDGKLSDAQWAMGAFVLPNAVIPDQTPLESFIVPVEAVESASGLTFFPPALKAASKPLCDTIKCAVVVRRFDDARKGGFPDKKGKR